MNWTAVRSGMVRTIQAISRSIGVGRGKAIFASEIREGGRAAGILLRLRRHRFPCEYDGEIEGYRVKVQSDAPLGRGSPFEIEFRGTGSVPIIGQAELKSAVLEAIAAILSRIAGGEEGSLAIAADGTGSLALASDGGELEIASDRSREPETP